MWARAVTKHRPGERRHVSITTVDPSNARPLATFEETTPDELDALPDRAHGTARPWAGTPWAARAEGLRRIARVLTEREGELALLATREMGKPLAESRAEVEKCARTCD